MISSEKLREIRKLRGKTQKEVAIMSGLTPTAIRNYELGLRSPSDEQLEIIAQALECNSSALRSHDLKNNFDIYQIIFDLEERFEFRPIIEGGVPSLLGGNPEFIDFLIEWKEMKDKHFHEEITDEELRDWKLSYPLKSKHYKR